MSIKTLEEKANSIRKNILLQVYSSGTGHPGGSLSAADIVAYLYFKQMNISIDNVDAVDRDKFVLSKGHAAPVLYGALAEKNIIDKANLEKLRKIGGMLQGHPDMKGTPGVDMSTGSLGQGISAATGMAMGYKLQGSDSRVYCIVGDGELQEGQVWEAFMFAASNNLNNLVIIIDNNNLQIDGTIEEVNSPYPIVDKCIAFNLDTYVCKDGNNMTEVSKTFNSLDFNNEKPKVIVANTIKGKGVSFMENDACWHGKAPNDEEYQQALNELEGQVI